jgi:hypothetical protein
VGPLLNQLKRPASRVMSTLPSGSLSAQTSTTNNTRIRQRLSPCTDVQPSEFEQFVMSFGKVNIVEVVEAVDRVAKSLVVLFDEEIIISAIDGSDVKLWKAMLVLQRITNVILLTCWTAIR